MESLSHPELDQDKLLQKLILEATRLPGGYVNHADTVSRTVPVRWITEESVAKLPHDGAEIVTGVKYDSAGHEKERYVHVPGALGIEGFIYRDSDEPGFFSIRFRNGALSQVTNHPTSSRTAMDREVHDPEERSAYISLAAFSLHQAIEVAQENREPSLRHKVAGKLGRIIANKQKK